jgi:ribosomal protein S18 acetylase RimI-like enzyme
MKKHTAFSPDSPRLLGSCSLVVLDPGNAAAFAQALVEMDPWRTMGYRFEKLEDYLVKEDSALHRFAVLSSDETAGIVCMRHPWLMGPFIELLAIHPAFQGRGFGRCIIDWVGMEARPASKNVWTTVSSFNLGAARFYTKMGFSEVGCLKDLVRSGFDEILLRKRLAEL